MAKKKSDEPKMLKIRQVKSVIGTKRPHREVVRSLGLRHPHHVVERPDTPAVRGMVNKVAYMVEIVEEPS
jgi:large subunit ribosomal protein L30